MSDMILNNIQFGLGMGFLWVGAASLFGGKIKRVWLGVLCYMFFLCAVLFNDMSIDFIAFLLSILGVICYMLTVSFSSPHRNSKKICVLFILLYLQELFEMVGDDISFIYRAELTEQKWNTINSFWSLFVISAVSLIYSRNKRFWHDAKFKGFIRKSMIPLLILVAFEIVVMVVWYNVSLKDSSNMKSYLIGVILSSLSMISIGIIVVMVIYIKNANDKMEQMLALEQRMKQLQADYYETLLEKEEATRRYRHDMNNHLICLRRLIEDGDIDGTKEYIGEMNANMQEIKRKSYNTGIPILDVLMNYHVEQLKQEVTVKVRGRCECHIAMSDIDMCIIFSNLIQNAVEALNRSCQIDDFLNVEVKEGKSFASIRITNSLSLKTVKIDEKGNLQTVKNDKRNHGIGVSNAKETVYKNGGTIDYQIEEGQISCEVILPIWST